MQGNVCSRVWPCHEVHGEPGGTGRAMPLAPSACTWGPPLEALSDLWCSKVPEQVSELGGSGGGRTRKIGATHLGPVDAREEGVGCAPEFREAYFFCNTFPLSLSLSGHCPPASPNLATGTPAFPYSPRARRGPRNPKGIWSGHSAATLPHRPLPTCSQRDLRNSQI